MNSSSESEDLDAHLLGLAAEDADARRVETSGLGQDPMLLVFGIIGVRLVGMIGRHGGISRAEKRARAMPPSRLLGGT